MNGQFTSAQIHGENIAAPPVLATQKPISVAVAQQAILTSLQPVSGWERVALRTALDRVLAEQVIAPCNVPAHDNSAMDGYALRFNDLSSSEATVLQVLGTAFAGKAFTGQLAPGGAVRIMTGAVLPLGADCIVVQEDVQTEKLGEIESVSIPVSQKLHQNIRWAGEDLAKGQPALLAGKKLGPADIGLLASLGFAEVSVYRRLRVAFFSTGDELASIGQPLALGEIYDSNRYTLWSNLSRMGVEVLDMGVVRDDPAALERALLSAAGQADAIITTGGVSVGEADFIKEIMARLGSVGFWKVNLKPGRPMAFGKIGQTVLFGLPGNPVATMVSFHQFVSDALFKMMGVSPLPVRPTFKVFCLNEIKKTSGRREFLRGILQQEEGKWQVRLAGSQSSGVLRSMSEANCYLVLSEAQGQVRVGDLVEVQMFEGLV